MRPEEIPAGLTVGRVIALIVMHPWRLVLSRWNYKSAILSSLFRAHIFLVANLTAGLDAALAAMAAEFVFRFLTSGVYGALTQAFRRAQPERAAMLCVMVLLPVLGHSMELALHWLRDTPNLVASIGASIAFTAISTAFNLFAMRRGALIVGSGSEPLWRDLVRMPSLIAAFLFTCIFSWRSKRFI